MSAPSAVDLLDAWDLGRDVSPGERGLLLLAVAEPDVPPDNLGSWSVGARDAALLALRERVFGPRLVGLTPCPRCGERLEFETGVADVAIPPKTHAPDDLSLARDGFRVAFRLPSAADLAGLSRASGGPTAEVWLLERCVVGAWVGDSPVTVEDLPVEVMEAVIEEMAAADPQAEVELSLDCPACGCQWRSLFDIVGFLWREIDAWATLVLREIHTLASAYGWSEREILALSPRRRRHYLELIEG